MKFLEIIFCGFFDFMWYVCEPDEFGLAVIVLIGPYVAMLLFIAILMGKKILRLCTAIVYAIIHFCRRKRCIRHGNSFNHYRVAANRRLKNKVKK